MFKKIVGMLMVVGLVMVGLFSVRASAGLKEAWEFYSAKNYAAAEAEFRNILPTLSGEDAADAYHGLGMCFFDERKLPEAMVEFQKMENTSGAAPDQISIAHFYQGCLLVEMKKYDEGMVEYEKAKNVKGINPDLILRAGWHKVGVFSAQQKYDEAISELREIIKTATSGNVFYASMANLRLGEILDLQGKTSEAQEAYGQVLLIRNAPIDYLKQAFGKIDFVLMTQDDADALRTKAYRTVSSIDKLKRDKDGNLIYGEYLAWLLVDMSPAAQEKIQKSIVTVK